MTVPNRFLQVLAEHELDLHPLSVETLQLNITRACNQACAHCHVDASPSRTEMMPSRVIDECLDVVGRTPSIATVDITGGAPELHPEFERLVVGVRAHGRGVIVRHNLTVTVDGHPHTGASMGHLPRLFAEHGVHVVSSLPCYLAENTDSQRGLDVHEKSIESIRRLNAEGFGVPGSGLRLDLVHNPTGAGLPGSQEQLEAAYRRELALRYGVSFNRLLAMGNMPINRFGRHLRALGRFDEYVERVRAACNPAAAIGVMCRSQVSVAYDGTLYDCDFNQMLGMAIGPETPLTVFDFDERYLIGRTIRFDDHCHVCAAGTGSSCRGAIA